MKVLAVLGLAVALLSGCGGTTTSQPAPTVTVTASSSAPVLTSEAAPASATPSNPKSSATQAPDLDAATTSAIRAAVSAELKKAPKTAKMQIRYVFSGDFDRGGYAACPRGFRVIGGGFKTPNNVEGYVEYSNVVSRPRGESGWEASAYAKALGGNISNYVGIPTYAICVK